MEINKYYQLSVCFSNRLLTIGVAVFLLLLLLYGLLVIYQYGYLFWW